MPNCDFYAHGEDHRTILDFIFSNPGWRLYEMYSRPNESTRVFHATSEILRGQQGLTETAHFVLYSPTMGGTPVEERIELQPGAIPGATFRYTTGGWGLIQLYLEVPRNKELRASHTNHNSEDRANNWAPIYSDKPDQPRAWSWSEVRRISGRLNRFIRKCGVAKNGPRSVLPGALAALRRRECAMDYVFTTSSPGADPIHPWELPPDDSC